MAAEDVASRMPPIHMRDISSRNGSDPAQPPTSAGSEGQRRSRSNSNTNGARSISTARIGFVVCRPSGRCQRPFASFRTTSTGIRCSGRGSWPEIKRTPNGHLRYGCSIPLRLDRSSPMPPPPLQISSKSTTSNPLRLPWIGCSYCRTLK